MEDAIRGWIKEPHTFIESSSTGGQLLKLPKFRDFYYNALRNEKLRVVGTVHRHFNLYVLYTTVVQKNYCCGKMWLPGGQDELVRRILRPEEYLDVHLRQETLDNVKSLIEIGRCCSRWVEVLGHVSVLFILPTDLPKSLLVWHSEVLKLR